MSNFLDQFTDENYKKNKPKLSDEQNHNDEISQNLNLENELTDKIDEHIFLDQPYMENKQNRIDVNEPYLRDEVVEKDPNYQDKKKKKIILLSLALFLSLLTFTLLYNRANHTIMPEFINSEKHEVTQWGKKYKMDPIYTESYDTKVEKDAIVGQSVEAGAKVKKGSSINFIISLGADPDELIKLPLFEEMTAKEIESWIQEYKMSFIQLDYQYSNDIEQNKFISLEIKDKDVSKENFKRKNKAIITVSKGKEVYEKDILVPDFKNKSKTDVEAWMKDKEFLHKFNFEGVYHDEKLQDEVISQSALAGDKVAKDDTLTFEISKGKAIYAPNYSQTELNSFDTINTNGANVINKELYTMNYSYGEFVEQSIEANTIMNEQPDTVIVVYYSIGKPFIKDLIGQSEGDLPALFYEFKGKGANISYNTYYINDCATKGTVVNASKNNEFLSTDEAIDVFVSNGSSTCAALEN